MVHHRRGLTLGFEARDGLFGVQAEFDDLQRDPSLDRLLLLGHVHRAEAAFGNELQQLVAIDDGAGHADWPRVPRAIDPPTRHQLGAVSVAPRATRISSERRERGCGFL